MNWSDFWNYSNRFLSLVLLCLFIGIAQGYAQSSRQQAYLSLQPSPIIKPEYQGAYSVQDTTAPESKFPRPRSVLIKSLMIPGWGQVVNKQIWKVPLIYGLLAGLTYYSIHLTKKYHDYRAAYYNLNEQTDDDFRFGPTPNYIPEGTNLEYLRDTRNSLHNRRDLIYLTIVLAYAFNALDAYIFAHLRTFDVSEDLSARATLQPRMLAQDAPGLTLSIELF